jgi:hypothetical protein
VKTPTIGQAAASALNGDTTRYKPERLGVVHDAGRTVPYGGVTTACQYSFGLRYDGGEFALAPGDAVTTCVLCLNAQPDDRGTWPPPYR